MENCIELLGSMSECTQAAMSGRAGGAGWVVPVLLLLGLFVVVWVEEK